MKLIFCLVGLLFIVLGYLIYFKKKYFLINGFEKAFREGKKDKSYAEKVGRIEFTAGIISLVIGIAMYIFQ